MTSVLELVGGEAAVRRPSSLSRVPVLLPVALDQTYDYGVPAGSAVSAGQFVMVPFGSQQRLGVIWDKQLGPDKPIADAKLKLVMGTFDVPPLPPISIRFVEWIANYTISPLGMVLRLMMGAQSAFEAPRPRTGVCIVQDASDPPRMTPARQRAINIASDGLIRLKSALAHEAGCTTGVIDGLIKAGLLIECAIPERGFARPKPEHSPPTFRGDQNAAVHQLRAAVAANSFSVTLLDGVTGSGKTEVYFEAVAAAIQAGRQVLVMLPEIALTSQFLSRFEQRFGVRPVEWHSALPAHERGRIWRGVGTGDVRCIVGARSALFLPFPDLGLIVVDEEHDGSFKQEDRVYYQARDMSVVRAHLGNVPCVLASATPSVESHVNAESGRYRHTVLSTRYSGVELPDVSAINMREQPLDRGRWMSPALIDAVTETLAAGRQSLLFLNRRGYAPLTLCRVCGHRIECPQCTAWLVEHRYKRSLDCHHCGFSLAIPKKCPKCGEEDSLVPCGPGVERIAEEVSERFPQARLALLSSDLIPGIAEMRDIIRQIESRSVDIIIGTQIVAKGHHFPDLATVGIVDGDLGLAQGADPRAGERTFQLLRQVTGRAGREGTRGRGLVQTYAPDNPVMQAIITGDREAFLAAEIRQRQIGQLPPFGRLVAIIVTSRLKDRAADYARQMARLAPPSDRISVLGPAEAPIAIVRGRYRFRLLVKSPRELDVQAYTRAWINAVPAAKGDLRVIVDVDPYSFL